MAQQIITQLETAFNDTLYLLKDIEEANINKKPAEGAWSAAQVARHLYKSTVGSDQMFAASTPEVDRSADERAENYRTILMDFENKLNAPEFLIPEEKDFEKDRLIQSLSEVNKAAVDAIKGSNLAQLAPMPAGHPLEGSSKLEIVHFFIYHTLRHNNQIEKIKAIVVD
jgi:DinB superfamily